MWHNGKNAGPRELASKHPPELPWGQLSEELKFSHSLD